MFNSPIYKRSRSAYAIECAFEYFVALLMSDAFLAKLLENLGFSQAQIGILSSFISLAFLFELCAVPVVSKITNTKRFSILFHTSSQAFFMFLYLIPLFFSGDKYAGLCKILVPVCLLLAYFGNYFVTTTIYRWGNSYVEPGKRGTFQASKEMISLISGVAVSLLIGVIIDKFEAADNLYGGFLFSAIAIAVFSICDLACLLLIQNKTKNGSNQTTEEPASPKHSMKEIMAHTFGNKSYRNLLLLHIMFSCTMYFTTGFLGSYKNQDLLLGMTVIQIINIGGQMARFAVSRPFGRLADKTSYAHCEKLGLAVMAAGFFALIFTSPATKWLIIAFVILYNMSLAGTHQNMLMMTYNFVGDEYYVEATAIKSAISGLCGFFASILGGKLLDTIQQNGNTFLGMAVHGQQILATVSFLLCLTALLFTHFIVEKQAIIGK